MQTKGFFRIRDFLSLEVSQLQGFRVQWPVITDEVWLQVTRLRLAVIPAKVKPKVLVKPVPANHALGFNVSPASQVVGMWKSSVTCRSTRVLRLMLGPRESDPLPKPENLLERFSKCVPVALMRGYDVNPHDLLSGLATQNTWKV